MPTAPPPPNLDSQQVEAIGRAHLVAELVAAGIEVARPERDKGIDLVAYHQRTKRSGYTICPIQLKVSRPSGFTITKKYSTIPGLVMAYVWMPTDEPPTTIAMSYADTVRLAKTFGWTSRTSWTDDGRYHNSPVTKAQRQALLDYVMTPDRWVSLIHAVAVPR